MSVTDEILFLKLQSGRLKQMAYNMDERIRILEDEKYGVDVLRGREISNEAFKVLAAYRAPLNYKVILTIVERNTGKKVYGLDPAATLLSAIHRDERISMVRPRSGLFQVGVQRAE